MDNFLYTAMTGAEHSLRALEVRANNLANAQTSGFRADLASVTSEAARGYGYDSRYHAALTSTRVTHTPGRVSETGRTLDVAIDGAGYLAVETGRGVAYTRAGSLQLDGDGALTLNGNTVLGDGGPIVLPEHDALTIGADGTISVVMAGEKGVQDAGRLLLVNPEPADLTKDERGLIVSRTGAEYASDGSVTINGGHLETSNVSAVEEMMQTMSLTRSFEMQMKLYKVADEMADAGNRLIRG
ncbi:flagellar basal body rod protein FlgF [Burkholderia sp. BCC0044]|uniref:flagellar basal body rod protein FlgF n=1 Tax=Burkholderia sp. BCC0044 TaxID=2676295 RepID=UPI00158DF1C1|nr:flagellar basal body rod protein FlgF [Burkholderia sp. BCC0044]